jgi:DNA-directed RNA polymerase beta subunit
MIPLQSAVQSPRLFYGARFVNQALAIKDGEAPLVQNLDPEDKEGRSFDEQAGERLGAVRARLGGKVLNVSDDAIRVRYENGETADLDIYNNFVFNQKSGISSRPLVKPGDAFTPGQLLAASSYTDDNGTQNMGLNARIGLVPWKGYSMDDAIPISESFAKRLSAIQYKTLKQDASDNFKGGLTHYRSLFPSRFAKEVLSNFTEDGIVKPGTLLQPGDPVILGTMPRTVSSAGANIGRLSKALSQSRRDASVTWDGDQPAEVVDARRTRNGMKVSLRYITPTKEGDKIVLRAGAKGTVSKIIPDDMMPRTEDGQPLDALLNPLSLVSRANPSSQHEIRLGKIAKQLGKPIKVPSFLPKGKDWNSYIDELERQHGVSSAERVFDPESNRFLDAPVTVGYAFVNKLHHTAHAKMSSRGSGSYDLNQQPARGGGDAAQAKRFSGLENFATLSSGAYAVMRENSTLRGQLNDDYWRSLRSGKPLPKVGAPFVWNKFRALLSGAGIATRDIGGGRYRLSPMTDDDLDKEDPIDIENGEIVRATDLSPVPRGLFDPRIVTGEKWGRIKLPRPVINPAMEDAVRVMLGLTGKQLDDVLAGRADLDELMRNK